MPGFSAFELPLSSPLISMSKQNFPTLSFSDQREMMEGHSELGLIGDHFDGGLLGRIKDDGYESRSGSDNFEGASGDDQEAANDQPKRKKKYHRHTPHQTQELEAFFKDCNHPDEKQRADLSRRLGLENKQVKFWFQNRRTQMKTQIERHENMILKQENERLRAENSVMREAMANPMCNNCGGAAIPGQISFDEHQIRIENARLKDELNRICALANKFLGRPISSLASPMSLPASNSGLELGIGRNGFSGGSSGLGMSMGLDFGDFSGGTLPAISGIRSPMGLMGNEINAERSMLLELALVAMDELIKMAQADSPLWIKMDGGKEILNQEEYARMSSFISPTSPGYVTEASRETGVVIINSSALVETMMDPERWSEMFPSMVSRAVTLDVIASGMGGSRNGSLQVMQAEIQLLSPLVPVRQLSFLRFCKQHAEGLWAVVDASIDAGRNFKRLPSGFLVQDTPNGFSKITWVEHSQYDESLIHQLYRPLIASGLGFGAPRWIATLQRQCECLAIHMSSSIPSEDATAISPAGRRSMLKLAQRMANNFFSGICLSSSQKWDTHHLGNVGDEIKVMTRKNTDVPGEPPSIVLCAATSVWMPVSRQRVFDFLRDERMRGEWVILSGIGQMKEMLRISKGQVDGNSLSVLRANANNGGESSNNTLFLQETWNDTSCSALLYSPVEVESLKVVMSGGDSTYVALIPSGFTIHPDGHSGTQDGDDGGSSGCLLTVGLQILLNSLPTAKLTAESVETVNDLITGTIQKIKASLGVA
ncbi:homeobox-leucine zipper protein ANTHOCYANINLESS 2-like isoform X1 [Arachis stenosperma]|uniref:homeobox-leucine zipper protein ANTHOCYANINLESS 2-like isoform X1 n=2 Tax=Arachis stenosperma TaxID=217475 RepID=UPI0025AB923A|nr:homeobox-leucine zipper protein ANTHOCYANINLESS 2-like isoform X1 [Arachis stenosperma]